VDDAIVRAKASDTVRFGRINRRTAASKPSRLRSTAVSWYPPASRPMSARPEDVKMASFA
jgi:hypothetical protein